MEVSDITQQRKFLEGLAMKWEFRNWQDWYKTTREVLAFIVSKERKLQTKEDTNCFNTTKVYLK